MNQIFFYMIDRYKHQQLRIGLVSPEQISSWATKILPNGELVGEVTKPFTFSYKTKKAEKDGLFCERIFGPIKSGLCACGNYRERFKFLTSLFLEIVFNLRRRVWTGRRIFIPEITLAVLRWKSKWRMKWRMKLDGSALVSNSSYLVLPLDFAA